MPGFFNGVDPNEYGSGWDPTSSNVARATAGFPDSGGWLSRLFGKRRPSIDDEIQQWANSDPNYGPHKQYSTPEEFWADYYSGGEQDQQPLPPPATKISSAPEMRDAITRALSGLMMGGGEETGGQPYMGGAPHDMMPEFAPGELPPFESPTAGFPFMKGAYAMGPQGPMRRPGLPQPRGMWERIRDWNGKVYAQGGPSGYFSTGGGQHYVDSDGMGDGRSDHIDAKLSPGEFVQDAEVTSLLGDGDNEAGARKWEALRQYIRKKKGKALSQGKFSPDAPGIEEMYQILERS